MTRVVRVGEVAIGGGNPVVVQSMTTTDTRDVRATLTQIWALARAGCELVRVAVPDMSAAHAIREIKKEASLPSQPTSTTITGWPSRPSRPGRTSSASTRATSATRRRSGRWPRPPRTRGYR